MQLAYLAEADADEFRFRALDGDAAPFGGRRRGRAVPRPTRSATGCCAARSRNVVPDVARRRARRRVGSPGVGAYVGVPVRLRDGTVYGSLCCVSARPAPALRERDARLLEVLARIIADQIDRSASSAAPRGSRARRPPARRCSRR